MTYRCFLNIHIWIDCILIHLFVWEVFTRCLSYSQSIPISHDPSGRWDKCRHSPWPVMRGRKMRKMRKKRKCRWSLASLLLTEGQSAEVQKPGGHWRGWRTKRGQLLHSVVSFHSFLCLLTHLLPSCMLLFFYLIFISKAHILSTNVIVLFVKDIIWV